MTEAAHATPKIESLLMTEDIDPWDYFNRLRSVGAVVWDEKLNAWLVSSYQACKQVARDEKVWRHPAQDEHGDVAGHPYLEVDRDAYIKIEGGPRSSQFLRGPEHTRQHRWWARALSPRVMENWRTTMIRPIVDAMIDRFADRAEVELVDELAEPIPVRAVAAVMGMPWQNDELMEHSQGLVVKVMNFLTTSASDPELVEQAVASAQELREGLTQFTDAQRSGEGEHFPGMLWRDGPTMYEDREWDDDDMYGHVRQMFVGGIDTTAKAGATALYHLLAQPGLPDMLRAGGSKAISNFVEESLRLAGPVVFRPRFANEDTELAGVQIAKNDLALTVIAAANRDPDRYPRPDSIDLERKGPRDQLAFYFGPRHCAGAPLARIELQEIVAAALQRLPDLRLDSGAEPPKYRGYQLRGYRPLHALFTVES